MKCKHHGFILILLLIGAMVIAGYHNSAREHSPDNGADNNHPVVTHESILVYSGAGLKAPMEEVERCLQKYGIRVRYLRGSGMLITQDEPDPERRCVHRGFDGRI